MKTILSATVLSIAALSAADGYWHLDSTYDYTLDAATLGTGVSLHDVEEAMTVGSLDNSYNFNTKSSAKGGSPTGEGYNFLYTEQIPFLGPNPAMPVLRDSFLLGVMDGVKGDLAGQRHLALFMNPTAAANVAGIPYDEVFATSDQPYQFGEDSIIAALLYVHRTDVTASSKSPYYDTIYKFEDQVARVANVDDDGTVADAWFTPSAGFTILDYSDGQVVGRGTNTVVTTFTPVPEPASFAALGLGVVAMFRRRRRG